MEAKAIRTDAEYRKALHEVSVLIDLDPDRDSPEGEQRLADDELAQAQHDEWVRAKVAAARADKRPGMSTAQLRTLLNTRYEELRIAP